MLEFDKDLVDLIEAINNKNLKGYRVKLFDIMCYNERSTDNK